jgi:hypothetical protein
MQKKGSNKICLLLLRNAAIVKSEVVLLCQRNNVLKAEKTAMATGMGALKRDVTRLIEEKKSTLVLKQQAAAVDEKCSLALIDYSRANTVEQANDTFQKQIDALLDGTGPIGKEVECDDNYVKGATAEVIRKQNRILSSFCSSPKTNSRENHERYSNPNQRPAHLCISAEESWPKISPRVPSFTSPQESTLFGSTSIKEQVPFLFHCFIAPKASIGSEK